MQNAEPNVYGALATIRNGYMQMQWSRLQIYLVFNTVALPFVFNNSTNSRARAAITILGTIVSVWVPIAIWRGQVWLRYFNDKMAELERVDFGLEKSIRVHVFSDIKFIKIARGRLASRKMFIPLAITVTMTWIERVYVEVHSLLNSYGTSFWYSAS